MSRRKWQYQKTSPDITVTSLEHLARLPIVDCPDGVLFAAWWYWGFKATPRFRKHMRCHIRQTVVRVLGVGEHIDDIEQLWHAFKGLRAKAHYRKLCAGHPQYDLWLKAYRSSLALRATQWRRWRRIPPEIKYFTVEAAAKELELPFKTMKSWIEKADGGEIPLSFPVLLNRKAYRKATKAARAEMRSKIMLEANTRRVNGVEHSMAGVDGRTAADVDLIPRKQQLAAKAKDVEVYVEGGQIVVDSDFTPHAGQLGFLNSGARFRFIAAGRRGGKTKAGAEEAVRHALMMPGSFGVVIGPTYGMVEHAKRAILSDTVIAKRRDLLAPGGYLKREGVLRFSNGSIVSFRSAEWEDTLRGAGNDWVWIDEAAFVKDSAFKILLATTSDTQGRIWCTSSPLGRNWFYAWHARGAMPEEPDVESWRFPSTLNPLVTQAEVDRMKRSMPEAFFRQEYLAEWVDGLASVFGDLTPCLVDAVPQEVSTDQVVIGMDVARKHDFSAIVVMTAQGHILHTERFNKVSWKWQRERLLEIVAKYGNCPVLLDASGMGDPFLEDLREVAGLHVVGYTMSAPSAKRSLIEQLILDLEGGRIWLPKKEERLLFELAIYRREITKSGAVRYSAPHGEHDDMVIGLALANWAVRRLRLAEYSSAIASASAGEVNTASQTGPSAPGSVRRGLFERAGSTHFGKVGGGGRRGFFN